MDKSRIPADLAAQYARLVDDCEFGRMTEIMWPDFSQQGPGFATDSCEAFIAGLEFLRRYERTFHLVGNQFGEWEGESYRGETYCVASHLYRDGEVLRKMDMAIRYRELIELRDGVARYRSRDLDVVWTEDRALEQPGV